MLEGLNVEAIKGRKRSDVKRISSAKRVRMIMDDDDSRQTNLKSPDRNTLLEVVLKIRQYRKENNIDVDEAVCWWYATRKQQTRERLEQIGCGVCSGGYRILS